MSNELYPDEPILLIDDEERFVWVELIAHG
jgi:hypothetical protein